MFTNALILMKEMQIFIFCIYVLKILLFWGAAYSPSVPVIMLLWLHFKALHSLINANLIHSLYTHWIKDPELSLTLFPIYTNCNIRSIMSSSEVETDPDLLHLTKIKNSRISENKGETLQQHEAPWVSRGVTIKWQLGLLLISDKYNIWTMKE